jgi:formate dehydrogenase alpha subunit
LTSENKVTITIDGRQVEATPGAKVLESAIEAGIYVPYLCYHPGMTPYAACRMCVIQEEVEVEVERDGQMVKEKQLRPPAASCTMPVRDGMAITTVNDTLRQLQRGVMEMLISEHPHGCLTCHRVDLCGPEDICQRHVSVNDRCVTCPKNDRCELKDTVRFLGMDLNSPMSYKTRDLEIEVSDPFYDRDYNLCIVCGRCVRVCEEVRGDSAITFVERAGLALVGTSKGMSLLESGCEFCGACLDVCPVGALTERDHKWDKAVRVERTVCSNCPVGCQVNLEINKREKVIRVIPELNAPANHGQACYMGKFGLEYVNDRQRLRHPMVRRDGELQKATWEEALSLIAERLAQYKGSQFAAVASARSTNESAYVLQKFTRIVMESNNVDVESNTRPALTRALGETLGYAASTNPTWDLRKSECILAVDTNTTEEHNVLAVPIKQAAKDGANLIVIDAREVELTRYAHLWLRPRPGTTLTLLAGLLRSVLDQGFADETFIQERCEGLDELTQSLEAFSLEQVTQDTGVSGDQVQEAARVFAAAGTGAIIYALDNVVQEEQTAHVQALADLALITGNVGRSSTGLYALRQGANGQGATDLGCAPDLLPGYQPVSDAEARQRVGEHWGADVPEETGFGVASALEGARNGTVKAMLVLGDLAYFTNATGDGYEALEQLEFLVVHDAFMGAAAQRADVVLPATTFADEDGTYTNLERRVQLLTKAITPPNLEARSAWQAVCQLARQMGEAGFDFEGTAQVFDEAAFIASKIYGGISHRRIAREAVLMLRPDVMFPQPTQLLTSDRVSKGIQWPCPDVNGPGTPVLYSNEFPGGKAWLSPVATPAPAQQLPDEFPMFLVPGRVLAQEDEDVGVERIDETNHIMRTELIGIHPEDATSSGIQEGDAVEVVSATERLRGVASVTEDTHQGVVAMTTLFGELATRLQASDDPDPMVKVPGLVVRPVRLEKVQA